MARMPSKARRLDSLRRESTQHDSTLLLGACGDFHFGADVQRNLGRIIINEVADAVMRDAAEFGPFAQGADGGFTTGGENTTGAKTDDVGELGVDLRTVAGSGNGGWVHTLKAGCQRVGGAQKSPHRCGCGRVGVFNDNLFSTLTTV